MSEVTQAPFPAPTARTLLESLAELIVGTRTVGEITPERLQATMRHPVETWSAGHYGFAGAVTPQWRYSVEVQQASMHGALFDFAFSPAASNAMPSAAPLCEFDYDRMAARLVAAGFEHRTAVGEHGRRLGEHFSRDGLSVMLMVQIAAESPGAVGPRCVTAASLR